MVRVTPSRVFVSPTDEADRFLPEGPKLVTVAGRAALAWVNIQTAADATAGAVHLRFWDTGELRCVPLPGRPGYISPTNRANTVLVGMTKEVGLFDLASGTWEPLATIPDTHPRTIINDGMVLPGGVGVIFGSKDLKFAEPIGELYLFTAADQKLTRLAGGQTCSNGKVLRGSTLFDIDTPRRVVTRYAFDFANRTLRDDGIAIDLRTATGFPDGMCDCGDGSVIIAFYNPEVVPAGRAGRYRLDTGELVEEWQTPGSPRVTCPLLVKQPDGVKLILTTATEGMPAELRTQCPEAGSLFLADTAFTDVPPSDAVQIG